MVLQLSSSRLFRWLLLCFTGISGFFVTAHAQADVNITGWFQQSSAQPNQQISLVLRVTNTLDSQTGISDLILALDNTQDLIFQETSSVLFDSEAFLWEVPPLGPGTSETITLTFLVSPEAEGFLRPEILVVQLEESLEGQWSENDIIQFEPLSIIAGTSTSPLADISLSTLATPPLSPDQNNQYFVPLVVENTGSLPATNVVLDVIIPRSLDVLSATPQSALAGTFDTAASQWVLASDLDPGASAQLRLLLTPSTQATLSTRYITVSLASLDQLESTDPQEGPDTLTVPVLIQSLPPSSTSASQPLPDDLLVNQVPSNTPDVSTQNPSTQSAVSPPAPSVEQNTAASTSQSLFFNTETFPEGKERLLTSALSAVQVPALLTLPAGVTVVTIPDSIVYVSDSSYRFTQPGTFSIPLTLAPGTRLDQGERLAFSLQTADAEFFTTSLRPEGAVLDIQVQPSTFTPTAGDTFSVRYQFTQQGPADLDFLIAQVSHSSPFVQYLSHTGDNFDPSTGQWQFPTTLSPGTRTVLDVEYLALTPGEFTPVFDVTRSYQTVATTYESSDRTTLIIQSPQLSGSLSPTATPLTPSSFAEVDFTANVVPALSPGQFSQVVVRARNTTQDVLQDVTLVTSFFPGQPLSYTAGTVYVNGRTQTDASDEDFTTWDGNTLRLDLPILAPGGTIDVVFDVHLDASATSLEQYIEFGTTDQAWQQILSYPALLSTCVSQPLSLVPNDASLPSTLFSHPYAPELADFWREGILQGQADTGELLVDVPVNRAEAATLLLRALQLPVAQDCRLDLPFTDVQSDAWYASALSSLYDSGIMTGYTNIDGAPLNRIGPADEVRYGQFAKMITLAQGFSVNATPLQGAHWAQPYIDQLRAQSLLPSTFHFEDNYDRILTRGDIVALLHRQVYP